MLTGRPPFSAPTLVETLDQIRLREPVRPSQLQPGIPADLENVCLKCLEKEPARRYGSACDLANDLRNYLDGRAVAARPISGRERALRWCRRNPLVAGLAGSLGLALLFGVAGITWKWRETVLANRRATASLEHARSAIDRSLTLISEEILLDQPGFQQLRQQLLTAALEYYEQLIDSQREHPELLVDLADAHAKVGQIRQLVGSLESARDHFQTAIEIENRTPAHNRSDAEHTLRLIKSHGSLADVLFRMGQLHDSEKHLAFSLTACRALHAQIHENADVLEELASLLRLRGVQLKTVHQTDEAQRTLQEAVDFGEQLVSLDSKKAKYQDQLATAYRTLGELRAELAQWGDATMLYSRALQLLEGLMARRPNAPSYQFALSNTLDELGRLEYSRGKLLDAESSLERLLELADRLAAANPTVLDYQSAIASRCHNLAQILSSLQRFNEAELNAKRAVEILREVLAERSTPDDRAELAVHLELLAEIEMAVKDLHAAEGTLQDAFEKWKSLTEEFKDIPSYRRGLAMSLFHLGVALLDSGNLQASLGALTTATEIAAALRDEYPQIPDYQNCYAFCLVSLAKAQRRNGQVELAEKTYQQAAKQWKLLSVDAEGQASYRSRRSET